MEPRKRHIFASNANNSGFHRAICSTVASKETFHILFCRSRRSRKWVRLSFITLLICISGCEVIFFFFSCRVRLKLTVTLVHVQIGTFRFINWHRLDTTYIRSLERTLIWWWCGKVPKFINSQSPMSPKIYSRFTSYKSFL